MKTLADVRQMIDTPLFHLVGDAADAMDRDCFVVGGYVRDLFLERHSKDVDFVTVGSGIDLAKKVASMMKPRGKVNVYKNYGTAQVHGSHGEELEFVGARKESYRRESRNPIVEDGTLDDDISRRDFTINAMALRVDGKGFGELVDMFGGLQDLERRTIRTPLDPDITFSDDPLRMMRAIRFATQLKFSISYQTFEAIRRNAERIKIISAERIYSELTKIMQSAKPSIGWTLLLDCGLLKLVLPQLHAMCGVQTVNGRGHKDNFYHTMQVLDAVAMKTDDVWLRWAALFHDIGKPVTKKWIDGVGWTFHNHNFVGAKMIPSIFRALKFPMDEKMKFVAKMVELHMRPIALVEETVTDSAVRRLLVDAGDDIESLMTICEADITSKNSEKVKRFLENYHIVRQKIIDLEERDRLRNWQPPITGNDIIDVFGLEQGRLVGEIKQYVREKLLNTDTPNDLRLARDLMIQKGRELGLEPIKQ